MTINAKIRILKLEIKMIKQDKMNNKLNNNLGTDSNILFFLKIE